MAEAANPGMDRYNRYYNQVLTQLQQDQGPERSDSQLKNYLTRMIRPSYDQAIRNRQQQTGQSAAAVDTDAAGRGMGTSTWVTDAKNRLRNSEAADIATMNSNYNATVYDALLNLINQRDQNRMNLMSMAQGIAGNMYDRWKNEEDALAAAGIGGGGRGGGSGRGGRGGGNGGDDDVDDLYGTNANDKTSLPGMAAIESGENLKKYKTGTYSPSTAGQMTQIQRERTGLDDRVNGQYTNTRNTLTTPEPVNKLNKGKKIQGVGLTMTTTRR